MSLYGAPLWEIGSDSLNSFEYTYNRSIKIMFDLPIQTHRYLIETVSKDQHMKFKIFKRHIGFKNQVKKSSKKVLKHLYSIAENDCNSITGKNLRKIMLFCDADSISSLNFTDIDNQTYSEIPESELWRVTLLEELLMVRQGKMDIPGFTPNEITNLLDDICIV